MRWFEDGLAVPCVTIHRTNATDLIDDYRIYIDITPIAKG